MREVTHIDSRGNMFLVRLPDDAPDSDAEYGIVIGPPDLAALELPTPIAVRLNNQLFMRKLFTLREATKRSNELFAALQAALRVDVQQLLNLYAELPK